MYSDLLYIHNKRTKIILSKNALKQINKIPKAIVNSLITWVNSVEQLGINKVRKISGYHDEPLKGDRVGQRSIRLNKAYRAIYKINDDKILEIITILEVHKHKY